MTKEDRGWPRYLFNGHVRTSTVALIVAFVLVWWLYQEFKPPPPGPVQAPATEVVPPGFVPDPNYTWVPRTNVQESRTTQPTTTTPTTTETTTPTESTTPTGTSSPGASTTSPTTTTPAPPGATPHSTSSSTSPSPSR